MADADPSFGLIVKTDAHCQIGGRSWVGIPTLIWPGGIDEVVSDWLRALVVDHGDAASSVTEYAKIMRAFLRFCRQHRKAWQSVDDEFLILWREHLPRSKVSAKRINACLKTIFAFYQWAEENKFIRYQVGIYAEGDLPAAIAPTKFPITAKRVFTKGRSGRVYHGWTTTLALSQAGQKVLVRHTPTEQEIRELHNVAVERLNGERDSLMFSWAEEAGPRRAEILQVCKSHLPTMDQLGGLIQRDEYWPVVLRRKGGRSQTILVSPDLIVRTLEYIETERRKIVEARRKNKDYREPDEVFLSSRTGKVLHPDSVTSIGRKAFRKAGISDANIHRLRARFAVRTIETLVDAVFCDRMIGSDSTWIETILVKAAEMMGHANPISLRPYLTYVLNRRIQRADGTKADALASRLRQLELQEGTLERRLHRQRELQSAASHIKAGRNKDAASLLRSIAEELD